MVRRERNPNGFSHNPIMIGYDARVFKGHNELGFSFPKSRLVGQAGFLELREVIRQIKINSGYPVILNIGDSSTSGWNSERVYKDCSNPHAAFFTHKTYSDLLR